MLKFRHKYQRLVDIERKQAKHLLDSETAAKKAPLADSDLEAENDKELEETIE